MPPDPRSYLPLRPVDLQLLLALAEQECHGYGLVQTIADRTDGLVALEPGTSTASSSASWPTGWSRNRSAGRPPTSPVSGGAITG
jgi:hypothetical protein